MVISDISANPSLINLLMALQTENIRKKNKITHFIQSVIHSVKFNISPIVEPYIISSVKLHIPTECYQ